MSFKFKIGKWAFDSDTFKEKKFLIGSGVCLSGIFIVGYIWRKSKQILALNSKCTIPIVKEYQNKVKSLFISDSEITMHWIEYGNPNGYPILYFHGSIGSNLEGIMYLKHLKKYDSIRLIVMDRPSCNLTLLPKYCKNIYKYIHKKYSMEMFFNDVKAVLKYLDIKDNEFGVIGYSLGGMFGMSSIQFLKPKFITLWCGMPLLRHDVLIRNKDKIPKDQYNYILIANSFSLQISFYLLKIMALYFKNTYINAAKEFAKNAENDDTFGKTEMGTEFFWYNTFVCMKNGGIKSLLWPQQMLYKNNWGFNFNDIDIKKREELKIFMVYGKNDPLITQDWGELYYNELINVYNFKNIQLNMCDDVGHWLSNSIIDKSFQDMIHYVQ